MASILKVTSIVSCSFLLCMGLSDLARSEHAPSPSDVMKTDSISDRQGFQSDDDKHKNVKTEKSSAEGSKTIKGELIRVQNADYFIKGMDGKEVRLHTDKTTEMNGTVKKGDRIEAMVNKQNHALSIRQSK